MRDMTTEEKKTAKKLFALADDPREGKTLFTVRFDPSTVTLYSGKSRTRRLPLKGAIVLEYSEKPAKTPSGGRYTRKAITVRTSDGRRWWGQLKKDTDVVKLRLAPQEEPNEETGS